MSGYHPVRCTGFRIEDHELRGVAEGGVDHWVFQALRERVRPIDPVLTGVIDPDPTAVGHRRPTGLGHRAGSHESSPTAGGLAGSQLPGGVDDDLDAGRVDAQLLDSHLEGHCVDPLSHLGPAVTNLDLTIFPEPDYRTGQLHRPVAQPRVLQTEAQPGGPTVGHRPVVGGADGVQAGPSASATLVHYLTGPPDRSRFDHVAATNLPAGDPDPFGQTVHDSLHGELGLVGSKAPERPADRIVGTYRPGLHVDGGNLVGPAGVAGGPLQHLHSH